jgi:hypothetical protein
MRNATLTGPEGICKRCNKGLTNDLICGGCKNELISIYDTRISWKVAYEIEKVSRYAMRNSIREDMDDLNL